MMKALLIGLILLLGSASYGQTLSKDWKDALNNSLTEFTQCTQAAESAALCYRFSAESVKKVYEIDDFFHEGQQRYMLIDEIYQYLEGSSDWTLLGKGYDQTALQKGQDYANEGKAVVAIKMKENEEYGHMAVILPGELGPSGSWGLSVPNSASFFTHQPEKSFVNKKLSYAFNAGDRGYVMIYGRK